MTSQEFESLLRKRIELINTVLGQKASEYATGDRLHNFKEAAKTFGGTPTEVCWSYMLKHLVSIKDIAYSVRPVTIETVREKVGDAVCYPILMEALITEQLTTPQ